MKMDSGRQYIALVKALLKINFSVGYWKANLKRITAKMVGQAAISLLAIGVGVFYEVMFIMLLRNLYPRLAMMGQQSSMLTLGISMSQIMVLIFGMFYVIAAFYFSKGTDQLMAMPMKPGTVLMSKFTVVLVNEYLTELAILGPVFGVYGAMSGAGAGYWVMCVLVFLLAPLLPLAISSLLAMLLAGVIAKGKNKTAMNILGIVIFMAVYFGFQYFVLFKMPQDDSSIMQYLATMNYNLALTASKNFPPSFWATLAVAENFNAVGLRYFAMFVGASALGVAAVGYIGSRYYYGVLMSGSETSAKKRAVVDEGMWNKLQQADPVATIASKDHRVLMRTSSYLMNCGTLPLIWPGLLFMYSLFGKNIAASAPEDQVIQFFMQINVPWIKSIGLMLLTMVVTTGSMIGATGFSREGRSLAITKALPISGKRVVYAKIRYALLFQLVTSIPMMAVGQYLLKLPALYALVAFAVGHIAGLWSIFGGILIDIMRPYLNWTDPTRAVKQNLNAVVPMFGGWGILFAQGYAAYKMFQAGWGGWLPIALIAAFNVLLAGVTFAALMASAEKRYNMIEL